ncbi:protein RALF-like 33 [Pistacia vera]|uniref:protein RALF-like 33 n=1 Tax=Pistacia vera TaxID=55513 RepID=UPI001263A044|nr:protein RALF-like 33 [Pistacia vera]
MARASGLVLMVCLVLVGLAMSWRSVDASGEQELSWMAIKGRCQGSIAECMAKDEFEMDTEINRRVLATTQYISYGALQRDTVPCSQRGASYYNCQTGAEANPYDRGCTEITRCRS